MPTQPSFSIPVTLFLSITQLQELHGPINYKQTWALIKLCEDILLCTLLIHGSHYVSFPLIDGVRRFFDIVQQVILLLLAVKAQGFAILDNLANLLQTGSVVTTLGAGKRICWCAQCSWASGSIGSLRANLRQWSGLIGFHHLGSDSGIQLWNTSFRLEWISTIHLPRWCDCCKIHGCNAFGESMGVMKQNLRPLPQDSLYRVWFWDFNSLITLYWG